MTVRGRGCADVPGKSLRNNFRNLFHEYLLSVWYTLGTVLGYWNRTASETRVGERKEGSASFLGLPQGVEELVCQYECK